MTTSPLSLRAYTARVLVTLALVTLGLLLWQLSELVLVVFGACVVAVLLDAMSGLLRRVLPMPAGVALILVIVLSLLLLTLLLWMFGSQVVEQMETIRSSLPAAWGHFQAWLQASPFGPAVQQLSEQLRDSASTLAGRAGALAMSATGGVTSVVLMLVGGIYLAAQPGLYRGGLLKLAPSDQRGLLGDALAASGRALTAWLGGQLLAMAVVGVLTGLGMWLLGVPVAIGIGLLTAVLDFVPIVGPILAAIPAILLGFTVSPQVALGVLVMFVVVQQIEGHLLQPLIQQRAVDLPPVLLLFSLFGIGLLFGPLGVVLAAPMTVVVYVLVKRLYVREALDTPTPIPGEVGP